MGIEGEVRSFLGRVSWVSDEGTIDEYAELFTDDATITFDGRIDRGRAGIVSAAQTRRKAGVSGPGSGRRHFVNTLRVISDSDGSAHADSYLLVVAETATGPSIAAMARYEDRLVSRDGAWRISQRVVHLDGTR